MAYKPNAIMKEETKEKYLKGMKMYLEGNSIEQIAKELHLERRCFSHFLKDNGIEVKNPTLKRNLNEDFFEVIDTEEKAYWLGFLYADGYIGEKFRNGKLKQMTLEVALKGSDDEHLIKFMNSLEYSNYKITHRTVNNSDTCRVGIYCTKLCKDLINKGCTPKKSLILQFPSYNIVPKDLMKHFIRGYIDGDGYLGVKHNNTCDTLRFSICSGSEDFLLSLVKEMGLKNTDYRYRKDNRSNLYIIEIHKEPTLRIINYLYKNSKVHLTRKYDLVLPFIENVD